jgi:hypothetical protein
MSNGVEFTEDVLLGQNEMANNRSGATATERHKQTARFGRAQQATKIHRSKAFIEGRGE